MNRRSFLKAVAAGALTAVIPFPAIPVEPLFSLEEAFAGLLFDGAQLIVKQGPSPSDPFAELSFIGWKAEIDSKKYGNYVCAPDEMTRSEAREVVALLQRSLDSTRLSCARAALAPAA